MNRARMNRRLERKSVLEVKARKRARRRGRLRTLSMALGFALFAVVVTYVSVRGYLAFRTKYVTDNPILEIRRIEVLGCGPWVTREQVLRWARVAPRENLFLLDLPRIQRDLERVPLLERVTVERVYPDLLRIRVKERRPVAQVRSYRSGPGGQLRSVIYYLDPSAFVIPELRFAPASPAFARKLDLLPRLYGLGSGELAPAQRLESPGVAAALEFLARFPGSPLARLDAPISIDLRTEGVLRVLTEAGASVALGYANLERQLRRWLLVVDLAREVKRDFASLDLSLTNNCPVTWFPDPVLGD